MAEEALGSLGHVSMEVAGLTVKTFLIKMEEELIRDQVRVPMLKERILLMSRGTSRSASFAATLKNRLPCIWMHDSL